MALTDVPVLESSIDIDAPPAEVWALVADLRNMPRWSPQCRKVFVRGGTTIGQGTKMVNLNRQGLLHWPTQSQVVRFEPGQEIAFRVVENWTVWSFRLEPTAAGGTRLTERREAPKGISEVSVRLTNAILGGVDDFTERLRGGMTQTLGRIKAEVER